MAQQITLLFYYSLKDFLAADQRDTELRHELKHPRSVKDLIESLGVPHTEVDLILANGRAVDFDYLVRPDDYLQCYPRMSEQQLQRSGFTAEQLAGLKHNMPPTPDEPRFVLDVHLGRLAAYLRLLGFDCLYDNAYDDPELADISARQDRILLSCDRQLLMRKQVVYGYFVRARQPKQQLMEIMSYYDLFEKQKPFTRCMHCNGTTRLVHKKDIEDQLLDDTRKYYDEFYQCDSCNKIYWQGSHFKKLESLISALQKP